MSVLLQKGQEIVPGYTLVRRIGSGMAGEVWVARASGGVPVAIKIIRDLGLIGSKRELGALRIVRDVKHPNLCPLIGVWFFDQHGELLSNSDTDSILGRESSLIDTKAIQTMAGTHGDAPSLHQTQSMDEHADVRRPDPASMNGLDTLAVGDHHDQANVSELYSDEAPSPSQPSVSHQPSVPHQMVLAMGLGEKTLHDRLIEMRAPGNQPSDPNDLTQIPGGIEVIELLRYITAAADAIDRLNQNHAIYHCDIKPQNILIVGGQAQVCDFGLARQIHDVHRTQIAFGTPAYGAPEMLFDQTYSKTIDQYSLAITYYELRTGRLPFEEMRRSSFLRLKAAGELDLTAIPVPERTVVAKATHLDPEKRYRSCSEFAAALQDAVNGKTSPSRHSPRSYAALLSISAILATAVLAFMLTRSPQVTVSKRAMNPNVPDKQLSEKPPTDQHSDAPAKPVAASTHRNNLPDPDTASPPDKQTPPDKQLPPQAFADLSSGSANPPSDVIADTPPNRDPQSSAAPMTDIPNRPPTPSTSPVEATSKARPESTRLVWPTDLDVPIGDLIAAADRQWTSWLQNRDADPTVTELDAYLNAFQKIIPKLVIRADAVNVWVASQMQAGERLAADRLLSKIQTALMEWFADAAENVHHPMHPTAAKVAWLLFRLSLDDPEQAERDSPERMSRFNSVQKFLIHNESLNKWTYADPGLTPDATLAVALTQSDMPVSQEVAEQWRDAMQAQASEPLVRREALDAVRLRRIIETGSSNEPPRDAIQIWIDHLDESTLSENQLCRGRFFAGQIMWRMKRPSDAIGFWRKAAANPSVNRLIPSDMRNRAMEDLLDRIVQLSKVADDDVTKNRYEGIDQKSLPMLLMAFALTDPNAATHQRSARELFLCRIAAGELTQAAAVLPELERMSSDELSPQVARALFQLASERIESEPSDQHPEWLASWMLAAIAQTPGVAPPTTETRLADHDATTPESVFLKGYLPLVPHLSRLCRQSPGRPPTLPSDLDRPWTGPFCRNFIALATRASNPLAYADEADWFGDVELTAALAGSLATDQESCSTYYAIAFDAEMQSRHVQSATYSMEEVLTLLVGYQSSSATFGENATTRFLKGRVLHQQSLMAKDDDTARDQCQQAVQYYDEVLADATQPADLRGDAYRCRSAVLLPLTALVKTDSERDRLMIQAHDDALQSIGLPSRWHDDADARFAAVAEADWMRVKTQARTQSIPLNEINALLDEAERMMDQAIDQRKKQHRPWLHHATEQIYGYWLNTLANPVGSPRNQQYRQRSLDLIERLSVTPVPGNSLIRTIDTPYPRLRCDWHSKAGLVTFRTRQEMPDLLQRARSNRIAMAHLNEAISIADQSLDKGDNLSHFLKLQWVQFQILSEFPEHPTSQDIPLIDAMLERLASIYQPRYDVLAQKRGEIAKLQSLRASLAPNH